MMLIEQNQNIIMADTRQHKLSIHRLNFFHPKPMAIVGMANGVNNDLLAIIKEHVYKDEINQVLSIIEVYSIGSKKVPKLIQSIIEYEQLVGIFCLNAFLLTVSKDQTINLYKIKSGLKIASVHTDYGPILCMKFVTEENLLLTGTEYGYVGVYRIDIKNRSIEPVSKMVKITGGIKSIDCTLSARETVESKSQSKSRSVRPGKRKRSDVSDDSESDNEDDSGSRKEYLDSIDITIYGASKGDVIVWDYHRKTIQETVRIGDATSCVVNSLIALKNGDIIVGDSTGKLSVIDGKSFTCKQNTQVLESAILCLAKNMKENRILVSGQDPTIFIFKRSHVSEDEYVLFEKIAIHTHDVNCMAFTGRKEFFSGSLDGFLAKLKLKGKEKEKLVLHKSLRQPRYSERIKFFKEEMLIQQEKSLIIWKLPNPSTNLENEATAQNTKNPSEPKKLLLMKAKTYVHSSSFNDKWISYSTKRGIHLFKRTTGHVTSYKTDRKLPNCNLMEICPRSRFLAVAAQNCLSIIQLEEEVPSSEEVPSTDPPKCNVVSVHNFDSSVKQMVFSQSTNSLVVACGPYKNSIYTINLDSKSDKLFKRGKKIPFETNEISFITSNQLDEKDSCIYAYTNADQLIKLDLSDEKLASELPQILMDKDRIQGLPEEANMLGMVMLSDEQCILYDSYRLIKVDIQANAVINIVSKYSYIVKMDNSVFARTDEVALVELTPNDYARALPFVKPRRKFGQ